MDEAEAKKAARRERNRLHAVASRKRRRERVDQLESDNTRLIGENEALLKRAKSLEAEVASLKSWVVKLQNPVAIEATAALVRALPLVGDENAPLMVPV